MGSPSRWLSVSLKIVAHGSWRWKRSIVPKSLKRTKGCHVEDESMTLMLTCLRAVTQSIAMLKDASPACIYLAISINFVQQLQVVVYWPRPSQLVPERRILVGAFVSKPTFSNTRRGFTIVSSATKVSHIVLTGERATKIGPQAS